MTKKIKLIACEVLKREIEFIIKKDKLDIEIDYTKKESHNEPSNLQKEIQDIIDNTLGFDYILLGIGLCGNSINGIISKNIPLIVPRAHDCCTLFLGNRHKMVEVFKENQSMPWGSTGYSEIGLSTRRDGDNGYYTEEYTEFLNKYGEDNAKFLWDTLHPQREFESAIFIKTDETYDEKIYKKFANECKGIDVKTVKGEMTIIEKLLNCSIDDDLLLVNPGEKIVAKYDNEEIIVAKKC